MQGSSSTPTAPTLDMGQSAALYEQQLKLQQQYLPTMTQAAGDAAREEYYNNLNFALGLLGNDQLGISQRYAAAMPTETALRESLLSQLGTAGTATSEYDRLQQALGLGTQLRQASMQNVGSGQLGNQLMSSAMQKVATAGQLTPQEQRDATQAARAAMESRGLSTSSAGASAELLNRDTYSRAREAEDLAYAQNVQASDLARRTNNAAAFNALSQYNTALATDTDRYNLGLLQSSAAAADAERLRQLTTGQDAYNFALSSNPTMMALGLGSGYANMTQPAMSMVSSTQGLNPIYTGGTFSSGNTTANSLSSALGGALSGAAALTTGDSLSWTSGLGGLIGGVSGLLSDRREKKNIKPIGNAGKVLGLTAYKFDYKNGPKGNVGFMAQDVKRVLPQAVKEVNVNGKKRLAIKPAVIGRALAKELAQGQVA